jgi:hypothetical protein
MKSWKEHTVTPEKPEKHAIVIVNKTPQIWNTRRDDVEAFASSLGGKLIRVCATREEAEAVVKTIIDSNLSES